LRRRSFLRQEHAAFGNRASFRGRAAADSSYIFVSLAMQVYKVVALDTSGFPGRRIKTPKKRHDFPFRSSGTFLA
jgi:hypothetical protein